MTEDQLRELFREMRDERVPADSLARVRARVADRTRPRFGWRWIAGLGAAPALAGLLALVFMPQQPPAVELPQLAAHFAAPPPLTRLATPAVPVRHHARPQTRIEIHAGAGEIRIETDDPEVVILLTGE